MAAKVGAKKEPTAISDIIKVVQGVIEVCIVGRAPIILNRLSEKAKRELLLPKGRLTAIDKATRLKHDPVQEYRDSAYRLAPDSPTLVGILSTAFKGAMKTAALDMPGAKKAQVGRLCYVTGNYVPIFGVPQLFMAAVRSADMARTPDIRTRAIIPEWATRLTIKFAQPIITPQAVLNLLAAGGICSGVGDWRVEKGSGSFGLYEIVDEDDADFQRIVAEGGREAQVAAFDVPSCYDEESADLLSWYDEEVARRQREGRANAKRRPEVEAEAEAVTA